MGEIFLARARGDAGFEKLVVVKRLLPELVRSTRFVAMLHDEARIAARLSHPNVCEVYDLGEADGEHFIVMQLLEGVPLTALADVPRRDLPYYRIVASLAQQACEGLHHAHELADAAGRPLGLVHRDVSPSNLLVTTDGVLKVLDFGIAKAPGETQTTELGLVKGKVAFMSPEQIRGEPLDRRSDLFALGAVLHELCTGRRLFARASDLLVTQAVLSDPIPDVREVEPAAPQALARVLARALSRAPGDRFATAREMGEAAATAAASFGGLPAPASIGAFVREHFAGALDDRRRLVTTAITPRAAALAPRPPAEASAGPARPPSLAAAGLGFALLAVLAGAVVLVAGPEVEATREDAAAPSSGARADGPARAGSSSRPAGDTARPAGVTGEPGSHRSHDPASGSTVDGAARSAAPEEPAAGGSASAHEARASATAADPRAGPGAPARTEAASAHGWLSIDSSPYATVWVDGRRAGVTPLIHHRVAAGRRRVRAVLPDGREQRFGVDVPPGAEAPAVRLSWSRP